MGGEEVLAGLEGEGVWGGGLGREGAPKIPLACTSPVGFWGSGSAHLSVSQFFLFEDDYFEPLLDRARNSHFLPCSYDAPLTTSHL